ncbi:hypothetical protein DTO280E4_5432 [Paecilomyces variotii]|nr:hypothetical protein DTO169E5_1523 [Paecilomyces variotii]KAJ9257061.1 hypothetical protein DTO207G8_2233 [Paecilomyces variotii]KAJ9358004.1 hypothetical protein DTO280E4_5432 [Paecilomyces variotii]
MQRGRSVGAFRFCSQRPASQIYRENSSLYHHHLSKFFLILSSVGSVSFALTPACLPALATRSIGDFPPPIF